MIGCNHVCNVVLEWDENFRTLALQDGKCVAEHWGGNNFADFYAELDDIESICLACLREPLSQAMINASSRGVKADDVRLTVVAPYPQGTQLPPDDMGGFMENQYLYLRLIQERVLVEISIDTVGDASVDALRDKAALCVEAHGAKLTGLSKDEGKDWVEMVLDFPDDIRVGGLARACMHLDVLLRGIVWDLRNPIEGFSLVAAGQADSLLGVRESSTIDAKAAHYSLIDDRQKFEFAADLASFANSDDGGLILIGIKTKKDRFGADVLDEIRGCKPLEGQIDRYYSLAETRIFPVISNLRIEAHNFEGHDIVAILVPPQSEARKPFLVQGGVFAGGKFCGGMFSFPVRSSDRKRYMTAERIQLMLALGYNQEISRKSQPSNEDSDSRA